MSVFKGKLMFQCQRSFGTSAICSAKRCNRKWVKYPNLFQERGSQRTPEQKLFGLGRSRIPYNKTHPITAKNTGPSVTGGSNLAAKLAAKHEAPPTGYINRYGKNIKVKNMRQVFVVPDLTNFKLKPYVGYRTMEATEPKFTAEDLYRVEHNDILEEDMKRIELGVPLEEVLSERLKKMDEELLRNSSAESAKEIEKPKNVKGLLSSSSR